MPAISTGNVLITGTNGFVGSWALKVFLQSGFTVRAPVRSESKASYLKKVFGAYGDRLEFVIIPDITKEGAFDTATVGVDAVVHIASPVGLDVDHPDELIIPAVNGTLGVLRSAAKVHSVQRVVYISSCAAVVNRTATEPRVYDENDWNQHDVDVCQREGRAAAQVSMYCASKTLAERSAWEFWKENKDKGVIGWDLVSLCPPWVFGPVVHKDEGGPDDLNDSNKFVYDAVVKGQYFPVDLAFIDVRDLAQAILLAVTKPPAGGERIIVAAGPFRWEDLIITAHEVSGGKTYPPIESYNPDAPYMARTNVAKAKELLGLGYRTQEEMIKDLLKEYEERGWL
ncbi:D-lactaldehyde dehydrogenase [Dichomitus squalens LYAD-421 SS1]|uniref:D-lactaldehyde dehydrogenase n=1 Tax=Dichomitus squalens TaxID=114155 RepID=A0A4V2K8Q4_9APHY|nr:D-lactaldehyde dehydrogenase [Dichomitus squalens LYAD-421 SS1]EJF64216.1 D-lactaldehyde dehydrogenase [Dichomitus squalens LYAD-421 SS1]TBU60948.1 D-lactaldehyde dehydrogenase [Dichomitus squalens]